MPPLTPQLVQLRDLARAYGLHEAANWLRLTLDRQINLTEAGTRRPLDEQIAMATEAGFTVP